MNAKFYMWVVVVGGVAGVWFFLASDMYSIVISNHL